MTTTQSQTNTPPADDDGCTEGCCQWTSLADAIDEAKRHYRTHALYGEREAALTLIACECWWTWALAGDLPVRVVLDDVNARFAQPLSLDGVAAAAKAGWDRVFGLHKVPQPGVYGARRKPAEREEGEDEDEDEGCRLCGYSECLSCGSSRCEQHRCRCGAPARAPTAPCCEDCDPDPQTGEYPRVGCPALDAGVDLAEAWIAQQGGLDAVAAMRPPFSLDAEQFFDFDQVDACRARGVCPAAAERYAQSHIAQALEERLHARK